MSLLVIGGTGYIGSYMAHHLRDQGEKVVAIDSLRTGFREAVPSVVPFYYTDIADSDRVR